jgi:hypothetical protein
MNSKKKRKIQDERIPPSETNPPVDDIQGNGHKIKYHEQPSFFLVQLINIY